MTARPEDTANDEPWAVLVRFPNYHQAANFYLDLDSQGYGDLTETAELIPPGRRPT